MRKAFSSYKWLETVISNEKLLKKEELVRDLLTQSKNVALKRNKLISLDESFIEAIVDNGIPSHRKWVKCKLAWLLSTPMDNITRHL